MNCPHQSGSFSTKYLMKTMRAMDFTSGSRRKWETKEKMNLTLCTKSFIQIVEIIHFTKLEQTKIERIILFFSLFWVSSKLTILYTILSNQVKIKTSRHGSKIEAIMTKCMCVWKLDIKAVKTKTFLNVEQFTTILKINVRCRRIYHRSKIRSTSIKIDSCQFELELAHE